jgi:hypothetical protein
MADNTLPALPSLSFPQAEQVFTHAMRRFGDRVLEQPSFSVCCYVTPETSYGACDGQECLARAVVHDVATEMDYCAKHYREVGRG